MTQPPLPIQPDLIERLNGTITRPTLKKYLVNPDGPEAATAITTLQSQLERVKEALSNLETANEALAAKRTQEQYMTMLGAGQGHLLEALDVARREARKALSEEGDRGGGGGA